MPRVTHWTRWNAESVGTTHEGALLVNGGIYNPGQTIVRQHLQLMVYGASLDLTPNAQLHPHVVAGIFLPVGTVPDPTTFNPILDPNEEWTFYTFPHYEMPQLPFGGQQYRMSVDQSSIDVKAQRKITGELGENYWIMWACQPGVSWQLHVAIVASLFVMDAPTP